MKIYATCMTCKSLESNVKYFQINDNNVYSYTCTNGHLNSIIHQEEKFELLFESAMNAIYDGYLREGVSSIASSLERLYEFCIKVLSVQNLLPEDVFTIAWKNISKQSERQIGAFIFLYTIQFKKSPSILNNKQVEFRNNVIHKGYFPTFDETILYAQETFNLMFEILNVLKSSCEESIEKVTMDRMYNMGQEAKKISGKIVSLSTPTILNMLGTLDEREPAIVEDYIKSIANRMR